MELKYDENISTSPKAFVQRLGTYIDSRLTSTYHTCPCYTLHWRHNGHDSVTNHQTHHYLLNRLFRRRSKKISKLRVTGLCEGNSPVTGEFPAQMASNAENVSIRWRHHVTSTYHTCPCYNQVVRQLNALSRTSKYLDLSCRKLIFRSFVLRIFTCLTFQW